LLNTKFNENLLSNSQVVSSIKTGRRFTSKTARRRRRTQIFLLFFRLSVSRLLL